MLDVPKEDYAEFEEIIKQLVADDLAFMSKKGRVLPTCAPKGIEGIFIGNERGFGFVEVEGRDRDIFIPAPFVNGAMNGDKVFVKIMHDVSPDKRAEGKVTKVINRANKKIVCTIIKKMKGFEAIPDNKKLSDNIKIPFGNTLNAKRGDKVIVNLTSYPTENKHAQGEVIQVIGKADTPETARKSVIFTYGLEESFSNKVMAEAENISDKVSKDDLNGRRDLTDKIIFTIDGKDAKDLDDAVSIEKDEKGNFILGVHIADVTHYVKKGGEIDKEALKRGTSVYLAGSVIPMLPKKLSNGICSLNENVLRLTLSVEMTIDSQGEITSHDIFESFIKTKHRMNYDDVYEILNGNKELNNKYKDIVPSILEMKKLAEILRNKRFNGGSIDFDFPETKIIFDETGEVVDITKYEYTIANIIIEEFMLAANRTIAEHFYWLDMPFVFRNHEMPSEEKMTNFFSLCKIFNIKIKDKIDNIHPKTLQNILMQVKDSPREQIVANTMLRSMMKAKYSTENLGHFGLNEKYYCHLTSPIRRLADLTIHRIIKSHLKGENIDYSSISELAAKNASEREIIAEDAENLSKKIITAQFMHSYLGYEFEATVVSITQSAFFVELENSVQGHVALSDLKDYYTYNENTFSLISDFKEYKIGDKVNVVLTRADKISGEIDFIPTEDL